MSDQEVLASLLQKFIDDGSFFCWGVRGEAKKGFLTLDGTVPLTVDEIAAIERVTGVDGQAWWADAMTQVKL